jgi:hypothetical protein
VAVFSAEGTFLNNLPVNAPYMLGVHHRTGAVYVLGGGDPPDLIVKFRSRKDPQPVYSQKLTAIVGTMKNRKRIDRYPVFTLDSSGKEPVIWLGSTQKWEQFRLLRLTEKNSRLSKPEEKGCGVFLSNTWQISVDRKRDELFLSQSDLRRYRTVRINGANGNVQKILNKSMGVFTFGRDNYLYTISGFKDYHIHRYDRDLKPAPFSGSTSNTLLITPPAKKGSMHLLGRGIAVHYDGTIYILHEKTTHHQYYSVSKFGPDGKLRKENLISSLSPGARGLCLDPGGNMYVGDPVKPGDMLLPSDFNNVLTSAKKLPDKSGNFYPIFYGSILKFSPEGGAGIVPRGEGNQACLAYGVPVGVKDALWQYFGVGSLPAYHSNLYKHYVYGGCHCEGMRFDVDDWGRTFAPDVGRFRVVVLDTNGNEICTFGSYGNQDSAGAESLVPTSYIPFAWPNAIGVSDLAVYVGDLLNRRIVRVKLNYAADESCSVAVKN